jgi:hypothetical protein
MWGGIQNVAGLYLDSSGDSGFTFDAATSTVRTVLTTAVAFDCENNWDFWGTAANEALMAAEPNVNTDDYDYRLYYIPDVGCGFLGVAYLGCSEPSLCRAFTFHPAAIVVAHELGHSVGVCVCVCGLRVCFSCG